MDDRDIGRIVGRGGCNIRDLQASGYSASGVGSAELKVSKRFVLCSAGFGCCRREISGDERACELAVKCYVMTPCRF